MLWHLTRAINLDPILVPDKALYGLAKNFATLRHEQTTEAIVIKRFGPPFTNARNKLECVSLASSCFSSLV